jgi:PKD repeat protein
MRAAVVMVAMLWGAAPAAAATTASFDYSPEFPYPAESVTLTSTSTTTDKIEAWDWDLDADGKFDDASGPEVVHAFSAEGEHPVGLRVRDTTQAESETVRKIVVIGRPVAAFGFAPASPSAGEKVTFTAEAQPSAREWAWDFDADGAYDDASGATAATTFPNPGTYPVGLRVTDQRGGTATAKRDVTVIAPPPPGPPPPAPFAISDQTPPVGKPVVFDAAPVAKGHGGVKDHRWDLDGDGTFERDTNKAPAVQVTFGTAGAITPALQLSFADGSTASYAGSMRIGPGAPPADCAVYCHVTFPFQPAGGPGCVTSVEVGLVRAEADCFTRAGDVYSTAGRVRVNGLDLYPITGGRIEIDAGARSLRSSGGIVTLQFAEFTLAHLNPVEWEDLGGEGGEAVMPNLIPGPTTSVEGFGITGRLGVTFREHRATFDAHVELPDGIGGFDAQLRLTVTAESPATLDELRISLPVGELQEALPIDHLILEYEAAPNRWLGDVGVSIGDYEVGAAVGFHTIPEAGLDELRASLGGLNVSVYAGVFLQEIRFDYATGPPPVLGGGITLSYGPEYVGRSLVSVDGNFHVTLDDPVVFHIDGEGSILGFKVAAVDSRLSTDGNFSFDASVRVGVNPLGPPRPPWWEDSETPPFARLSGEVHGWIDGPHRTFNSSGAGEACFGACFGATMLMSSVGVAGCARLGLGSVGGAYAWRTRRFDWLAGACDLGPWTATASPRARAAQNERTLTLPSGLDVAAFEVTGAGGAPRVTVTGPKGERIVTPAGLGGRTATSLVTLDPGSAKTYVAVAAPSGGAWKITTDPGSPAIAAARSAQALPDPEVSAKLGGKGARRTLRYRVKPLPGQTVVFSERSPVLAHEIGRARGAAGTLRFAPGEGAAGARSIVALVSQNGLPRAEVTVARYRAPRPARPGRPGKVTFRRSATSLAVVWRASAGRPRAYEVRVTTINRRQELHRVSPRRTRLRIADIKPADRVTVAITPLTAKHQRGRTRRAVAAPVRRRSGR